MARLFANANVKAFVGIVSKETVPAYNETN